MAKQNLNKKLATIIDLGVLLLALFLLSLFVYTQYFYKERVLGERVHLTVKVPSENIEELARKEKEVFFNNANKPVEVVSVSNEGTNLLITLSAPGEVRGEVYNFNGQRVLVNQKAEIHSSYFAQGKVTSITNENK